VDTFDPPYPVPDTVDADADTWYSSPDFEDFVIDTSPPYDDASQEELLF
jgi:hypothetical protein